MNELVRKVRKLERSAIGDRIGRRLSEFHEMHHKGNNEWFEELCFCILTSNSKARTAIAIQNELGYSGFSCLPEEGLVSCIKRNKHRFHNTKARYIAWARNFLDIRDKVRREKDPRAWLVKNVKGLGWKESSHFLRNVGYTDYAIIDRHVLSLLHEHGYIKRRPASVTPKNYLLFEKKLARVCDELKMTQAELDLYLWYMKAGDVLK